MTSEQKDLMLSVVLVVFGSCLAVVGAMTIWGLPGLLLCAGIAAIGGGLAR